MSPDDDVMIQVSRAEVDLLLEALDAYEYWQLGEELPRNNGYVFIPEDLDAANDPYWSGDPTPEQREAISAVERCRGLAARLGTTNTVAS